MHEASNGKAGAWDRQAVGSRNVGRQAGRHTCKKCLNGCRRRAVGEWVQQAGSEKVGTWGRQASSGTEGVRGVCMRWESESMRRQWQWGGGRQTQAQWGRAAPGHREPCAVEVQDGPMCPHELSQGHAVLGMRSSEVALAYVPAWVCSAGKGLGLGVERCGSMKMNRTVS